MIDDSKEIICHKCHNVKDKNHTIDNCIRNLSTLLRKIESRLSFLEETLNIHKKGH